MSNMINIFGKLHENMESSPMNKRNQNNPLTFSDLKIRAIETRIFWMGNIVIDTDEEIIGDMKERSEENTQNEA